MCFEGLARLSRRVWRRFVRGSREISLVPSLHRASTDALIYNVREQGEGGLNQGCLVLAVTLHNNLGFLNASFMQDLLSLCSVKGCTNENIQ